MVVVAVWLAACSSDAPESAPSAREASPDASPAGHWTCRDPMVQGLVRSTRRFAGIPLRQVDLDTGAYLFAEDWLLQTRALTAVGLGQHAALCPQDAAVDLLAMRASLEHMMSEPSLAFDRSQWSAPLSERLASSRGSVAALGFGALALAVHRAQRPDSRWTSTEQAWSEAIASRFAAASEPPGARPAARLVETGPGVRHPVDNAAAVGALAMHDRVTGEDHGALLAAITEGLADARDPDTGLLHRGVTAAGEPVAHAHGSGTFLAAWLLHRADPELSRALYHAGRDHLKGQVFGLYAMREYLPGVRLAPGEHPPLVFGYSVAATGFALGGAVAHGDQSTCDALVRTFDQGPPIAMEMAPELFADPSGATGSALADALILAMLTAEGSP